MNTTTDRSETIRDPTDRPARLPAAARLLLGAAPGRQVTPADVTRPEATVGPPPTAAQRPALPIGSRYSLYSMLH